MSETLKACPFCGGGAKNDESLMAVADWMHSVVDATWTVYTVLAVAFIAVLGIAVIAEIAHLFRRGR